MQPRPFIGRYQLTLLFKLMFKCLSLLTLLRLEESANKTGQFDLLAAVHGMLLSENESGNMVAYTCSILLRNNIT